MPTSATPSRSSTTSSAGWARSSSRSTSRRRSASSRRRSAPACRRPMRRAPRGSRPRPAGADRRPDRALQHARGRDRVLPLRRPDGPRRHLLHLPRLRDVHRLRLIRSFKRFDEGAPSSEAALRGSGRPPALEAGEAARATRLGRGRGRLLRRDRRRRRRGRERNVSDDRKRGLEGREPCALFSATIASAAFGRDRPRRAPSADLRRRRTGSPTRAPCSPGG